MFEAPDGGEGKLSTLCLAGEAAMSLHEDVPISRKTPAAPSSPWSCFPTWSRIRPSSPGPSAATSTCHGARTGQWTGSRRSLPARTSDAQHRSHRPRRRSRWATPPGVGLAIANHRQAGRTTGPNPYGTGVRTKAPEAVASKSPFPHPHRSPSIGARPLSPIPARACPAPRVSAPRPAHTDTSTPRI